jgi:uncharacterized membrane protein
MKRAIQYLLRGLTILLPLVITIALAAWLLTTIETWLSPVWIAILGENFYFHGLAFISFLLIAVVVGFSARWAFINAIWNVPGKIMARMPVLRTLYSTVTDVFDLMSGSNFSDESVVLVTLPGSDIKLIGIVTKKSGDSSDQLSKLLDDDHIAVLLPMSYNVGGYMIIVPRSAVESIDMSPSEAMQLTISGGLGKNRMGSSNKD